MPHKEPQHYGVLEVDAKGFLKSIVEKPSKPPSNLINTGLYKFTPEVFKYIDQVKLSDSGEYYLTDVIDILAHQGKVKAKDLRGLWLDFGKPQDIARVEKYVKDNY